MNILAIALLTATTATATPPAEPDHCTVIGDLAQIVMEMRQESHPMSGLVSAIVADVNDNDRQLFMNVITGAYDQPLWGSDEYKQRAVDEYRNYWELMCYEARS